MTAIANINEVKDITGIQCANCSTCKSLGYEGDGSEYAPSWPVCREFPAYEHLKSFPFKKEMKCWYPDFWHSIFANQIKTPEDVMVLMVEFHTAIQAHEEPTP